METVPLRAALTESAVCAPGTLVNRDVEESDRMETESPVRMGIGDAAEMRLVSMLCRVSRLISLPDGLTVCRVSRLVPVPAVPGRSASALFWGVVLAGGAALFLLVSASVRREVRESRCVERVSCCAVRVSRSDRRLFCWAVRVSVRVSLWVMRVLFWCVSPAFPDGTVCAPVFTPPA